MKQRLAALHGFRFKHDRYYNLPLERLLIIEDFLQKRCAEIIEYGDKADELLEIKRKDFTVNHVNSDSALLQLKLNLKADPCVTLEELAELMSVSKMTISTWIGKLKDAGEVRRVGAPKNGYWEVLK